MACHAGAAAIGDEGNIVLFGILKQSLNIQGRLRIGNTIGKYAKVAAAHGEPVGEALPAGVTHPIFGRVDTGRVWRQLTVWHLGTNLIQRYIRQWNGTPYALVQKPLPLFG